MEDLKGEGHAEAVPYALRKTDGREEAPRGRHLQKDMAVAREARMRRVRSAGASRKVRDECSPMNPVRAGGDGVRFPRQASNNGAGNPEPVCRDVPELHDSDLEALERDFPGGKGELLDRVQRGEPAG